MVSGASGDACAAREMACTDSAQVEGRRRAGPERNPPPVRGRRREAALQGDGRHRDRAMQAAFADGCSARDERRLRGGGARRSPATQSRPCQRWRITRPQQSDLGAEARIAKRPHPKAILRLPSGARRDASHPSARGKARLARTSPHDDRHRTNGTRHPASANRRPFRIFRDKGVLSRSGEVML